jgi:ribosomal protein S18 acetylase RimI-like enzyme
MAGDVSIRTATDRDFGCVSELYEAVDAQHARALPGLFRRPVTSGRSSQFLREMITRDSSTLLVAEHEGELVGLVEASVRDTAPLPMLVPHRFGAIATVVVRPDMQRSGVGRQLVSAAERWAASRGAAEVEIIVYEFNGEAISFYERMGYKTVSRRMNRILSGE